MSASVVKGMAWRLVPGRSAPTPQESWRGKCGDHKPPWLGTPHFIGTCALPYFEALLDATTHDLKHHDISEEPEWNEVVNP